MDEDELRRILSQDLSVGTEAFRDALLARCLDVLAAGDGADLGDDELELLAAAGDPSAMGGLPAAAGDPVAESGAFGDNGGAGR